MKSAGLFQELKKAPRGEDLKLTWIFKRRRVTVVIMVQVHEFNRLLFIEGIGTVSSICLDN